VGDLVLWICKTHKMVDHYLVVAVSLTLFVIFAMYCFFGILIQPPPDYLDHDLIRARTQMQRDIEGRKQDKQAVLDSYSLPPVSQMTGDAIFSTANLIRQARVELLEELRVFNEAHPELPSEEELMHRLRLDGNTTVAFWKSVRRRRAIIQSLGSVSLPTPSRRLFCRCFQRHFD